MAHSGGGGSPPVVSRKAVVAVRRQPVSRSLLHGDWQLYMATGRRLSAECSSCLGRVLHIPLTTCQLEGRCMPVRPYSVTDVG